MVNVSFVYAKQNPRRENLTGCPLIYHADYPDELVEPSRALSKQSIAPLRETMSLVKVDRHRRGATQQCFACESKSSTRDEKWEFKVRLARKKFEIIFFQTIEREAICWPRRRVYNLPSTWLADWHGASVDAIRCRVVGSSDCHFPAGCARANSSKYFFKTRESAAA